MKTSDTSTAGAPTAVERYYRLHSKIYDATRWSFLFGRSRILDDVAAIATPRRILEVGCGTGRNLAELARRFPESSLTGVDLSAAMLALARKKTATFGARVTLRHQAYGAPPTLATASAPANDLVLFSYALSMFNPGFEAAIAAAWRDLAPGGHIAVVDFHDTRFPAFARWMGVNHVRMEGQLQPLLRARFAPCVDQIDAAYGGVWRYARFVGRREPDAKA
jgi:S-adenosylmethionine-diacylgycerolhomoserine-N-methlytransferase